MVTTETSAEGVTYCPKEEEKHKARHRLQQGQGQMQVPSVPDFAIS